MMRSKTPLVLCLVWAFAVPLWSAAKPKKLALAKVSLHNPPQYRAFGQPLPQSEMALHVLNRLTFGPRPGETEALNRLGIAPWLDQQLMPEKQPESPLLAQKLEPFELLRLSIRDAYLHYPQPQMIAAVARGKQPLPDDPELREVVQHLADRYLRKKMNGAAVDSTTTDDESGLEGRVHLQTILTAQQIAILQTGKPEQKKEVLAGIPENRAIDFAYALRPGERKQLMPLAPAPLQRKLLFSTAPSQVALQDMVSGKILRAVYSNHQLQEEMVDFWFNHFNVLFGKGADRFTLPTYEREAIRPHALGKFYDLLLATAQSPAMLFYLDNFQSVRADLNQQPMRSAAPGKAKRGLNENYARELMELHTLGVNGSYTQTDVIEVARCFTGWTIAAPRKGGGFEFNEKVHDRGQKIVLSHIIHAGGGMEDGLEVLKILARSPQTAHHLSTQLAQRFVADDPPPSLVDRMAKTYLKTDGNIREVLRTMILSPEFFSQGAYRAKIKTPFEMVVSAVRATGAEADSALALAQRIAQLGEPLYQKIEPTGYSSANAEWVSSASLLSRMNFALALASNKVPGVRVDQASWNGPGTDDPASVAQSILMSPPSEQTTSAIRKVLDSSDMRSELGLSAKNNLPTTATIAAGIAMGSPEFQHR
jgi:uncharacterized protein (DUF1800 family)